MTQATCGKGEKISSDTKIAIRTCIKCSTHEYRDIDGHRHTACAAQATCGKGEKISPDSKTASRECSLCPEGQFRDKDAHRHETCVDYYKCQGVLLGLQAEYETHAPTPTSNRKCAKSTPCLAVGVEFEAVPLTEKADRRCDPVTQCAVSRCRAVAAKKSEKPKQYWANRDAGYKDSQFLTAMDHWCDRNCNSKFPYCPPTTCECHTQASPAGSSFATSNRLIGAGREYEVAEPGASSDRQCELCSQLPCPTGQHRIECGPGASKGICVVDCQIGNNCWLGDAGNEGHEQSPRIA